MSDRKIVLPNDVPIVGTNTFVVCARGHVNEAPLHPNMKFRAENGDLLESYLCGRCMFDFNVSCFGGILLPRETTRKEAEWKAREIKAQAEHALPEDQSPPNLDEVPS